MNQEGPTQPDDDTLIRRLKTKAAFSEKTIVDSNRELKKQRVFGYITFAVTGLFIIYFVVGLAIGLFLPFDGLHKFTLCALTLDIDSLCCAAFALVYFGIYVGPHSVERSTIICTIPLCVCGVVNIMAIVWMSLTHFEGWLLATIVFSLACVFGGLMLPWSFWRALAHPISYAVVAVEDGLLYHVRPDLVKIPISEDDCYPNSEPNHYGILNISQTR